MKQNGYSKNCATTIVPIQDVCEIVVDNNMVCVVKFKNDTLEDRIKLMATGFLTGNETLYKITKTTKPIDKTYVSIHNINGNSVAFDYGGGSETCINATIKNMNNAMKLFLTVCGVTGIK